VVLMGGAGVAAPPGALVGVAGAAAGAGAQPTDSATSKSTTPTALPGVHTATAS
jgi:hypothetical protein